MIGQAAGELDPSGMLMTILTPIGYLMDPPRFREWLFDPDPGRSQLAAVEAGDAIRDVAVPFMTAHAGLPAILDALVRDRLSNNPGYEVPAVLLTLGRAAEAAAWVNEHVASIADRTDPAAERYRRFASGLLELAAHVDG